MPQRLGNRVSSPRVSLESAVSISRKRIHPRELGFLGLVGSMLVLIGAFLVQVQGTVGQQGSSWRRIDLEALRQRIDAGDLRDREAAWYHPSDGAARAGVPTGVRRD
jgi:hypothetical protein